MELVSEQRTELFNNTAWKMLIDLALQYGWRPAGTQEPDGEDHPPEDDESPEEDVVQPSEDQSRAAEARPDHPIAQAVKSLFFRSGDPVLDSYFKNGGARVTAEDARALADALERALPDVPCHNALEHEVVRFAGVPGEFLPFGTPVTPFEWFSGENRGRLKNVIAICRSGGFKIC
jgi:hypothetical protein